jgi:hypothetical protein
VAADLSPLEQAAARVGLPGLKARVVPHDRRRGWWFRWGRGELMVSDRVIDRCAPADAGALLISTVLVSRMRRQFLLMALPLTGIQLAVAASMRKFVAPWVWMSVWLTLLLAVWLVRTSLDRNRADDQTVRLLGDATPLVRGLNEMNFEELHLAGKVLPARPDLHRRAERLVAKHGLCDAQPPT